MSQASLGKRGEKAAENFLIRKGYKLLARNFRYSRYGEIDLVFIEGKEVVFVEVKARSNTSFGFPEEGVDKRKIKKIEKVAQAFLLSKKWEKMWRIDVVAVFCRDNRVSINHFENVSGF